MIRARCRVCRSSRALTRRGRVWHHRVRSADRRFHGLRCPGSGRSPLGQPGPDLVPLPGQHVETPHLADRGGSGTIYLLHLDPPYKHARHYLGWAGPGNLGSRLAHHAAGSGANLLVYAAKAGGSWTLARTWAGDRRLERRIKRRGGAARVCPVCRPELEERLLAEAPTGRGEV
jgi:hypothetical protein